MTDKRFRVNTEDIGHIYIDNPNGEHMSWIEVEETLNELASDCSRLEKENEQLLEFKKRYDGLLVDYNNLACRFEELNEENEKLKQSEKDCQELNHKLINENDELEQEIRKFKRIIDILEVERCEYLTDKQARSKWGDNYD